MSMERTMASPNKLVSRDRNPRERGLRPLNNNR